MRTSTLVAALAVVAAPMPASAYCLLGALHYPNTTTVRHEVPVYLVAPNSTFGELPTAYVEQEIRLAIDQWAENSDSEFRPYYAGITTNTSTTGRIVIREDNVSNGTECSADACAVSNYQSGRRIGTRIWVVNLMNLGGGQRGAWNLPDFATMITHELGHAFGLDDAYGDGCPTYYNGGVMGGGDCHVKASLGLDDQLGIQSMYGERDFMAVYRETTDLATNSWSVLTRTDRSRIDYDFPLGSSTSAAPREYLGIAVDSATPLSVASACDNASCSDVDIVGLPAWTAASNMVSVANKSATQYAMVFSQSETQTDCTRTIRLLITNDGGATFTDRWIWDGVTDFHGVSLTHDPVSDRYVLAWRSRVNNDDDWRIKLTAVQSAAPFTQSAVTTTPWRSWRTPTVECTPQAIIGATDNCLLVWLSDIGLHPVWRSRFTNSSGQPVMTGVVGVSSIIGYGTPALTETRRSDYPWMMAIRQGDDIRVWRRSWGGNWSGATTVVDQQPADWMTAPSLSHLDDGVTAEVHLRYGI